MSDLLTIFEIEPWLFYTATVLLGLCVGSFLNVVIYRLPRMLERDWKIQCHEYLESTPPESDESLNKLGLVMPASSCPACGHKIHAWENIPIFSYIFLGGKCASCKTSISLEYPIIEALTAVLSLVVAWRFGVTLQTLAALLFTWTLVALTMIDIHKQLLPDNPTLPLLWLGIIAAIFGLFTDLQSSVIGAIAGYMVLWIVYQVFKLLTGKEGMGFGDFKLLAALGAWNGWMLLPQIILISSVLGTLIGGSMMLLKQKNRQQPIPFGPYLAIAGWIALLWGPDINDMYLSGL